MGLTHIPVIIFGEQSRAVNIIIAMLIYGIGQTLASPKGAAITSADLHGTVRIDTGIALPGFRVHQHRPCVRYLLLGQHLIPAAAQNTGCLEGALRVYTSYEDCDKRLRMATTELRHRHLSTKTKGA